MYVNSHASTSLEDLRWSDFNPKENKEPRPGMCLHAYTLS